MKFGAKRFPLVIAPCSLFMSQSSLLLQSPISTSARSLSLSYMVHKSEIAFFSTSIKFLSWRWFLEKIWHSNFGFITPYLLVYSRRPFHIRQVLLWGLAQICRGRLRVFNYRSVHELLISFILIDLKLAIFIFLFLNYYYSGSLCTWY